MSKSSTEMPFWVAIVLRFAAIENLACGIFVMLFPRIPFQWISLDAPNYPSIVQGLGLLIAIFGVGYWIAARDAATHWAVVLTGLLSKLTLPLGALYAASQGEFPWNTVAAVIAGDAIWWLPFIAILFHSARIHEAHRTTASGLTLEQALRTAVTQNGQTLLEQSLHKPLLLVCVRHFGCTFCRETLADLARQRTAVDRAGLTPVIVYMGSNEQAAPLMAQYGLSDVAHISDPDRRLFQTLELPFGTLSQLLGVKAFWRALIEGALFRFGFGRMIGNGLQLSGAFIVKDGRIERAIRHDSSAERTDFAQLSCRLN